MVVQRILYNQLHTTCITPEAERILLMQSKGCVDSGTPVGELSFNIYSKLIGYAGSKQFVLEYGEKADFEIVENWSQGLISYSKKHGVKKYVVMDSSEAYVMKTIGKISKELEKENIEFEILPNTQFLIDKETFQEKYATPPVMETFYRWMRKRTGILMDGEKPEGGKWNYDKENRKFDRKFEDAEHLTFGESDIRNEACEFFASDIEKRGKVPTRNFPVSRKESLQLLDHFLQNHVDRFGELEDAMYTQSDFVHHSLLSVSMNFGFLTPQEVIEAVAHQDTAINNKEGFIRQVLGWREYMYHWFTFYKDELYKKNFFEYEKKLPDRFWWPKEGSTKMNCVGSVVEKVARTGYSHHIERLMIIGNFTLLVGYDPHHVNKRFWEQYVDAFERVVSPNVLGMSQYADGGNLATKPYVASANYVKKMSNFCKTCQYDPNEKYGENACPLNYLYWRFVDNNQETFKKGRQSFILNHLKKIDLPLIHQQSETFISQLTDEKDT